MSQPAYTPNDLTRWQWRERISDTIDTLRDMRDLLDQSRKHAVSVDKFVELAASAGLLDWLDGSPKDSTTPLLSTFDELATTFGGEL